MRCAACGGIFEPRTVSRFFCRATCARKFRREHANARALEALYATATRTTYKRRATVARASLPPAFAELLALVITENGMGDFLILT